MSSLPSQSSVPDPTNPTPRARALPTELDLSALRHPPHHDDIPEAHARLKPVEHRREDQANFLSALSASTRLLNQSGVRESDYMVMAGGSVFLYQLAHRVPFDVSRAPTDLDFVIRNDSWNSQVASSLLGGLIGEERDLFIGLRRITETRTHFGFRFPNAVVEAKVGPKAGITDLYHRDRPHFDIDFIPGHMVTIFPDDHAFPELRGVSYNFPTVARQLFERGRLLNVDEALEKQNARISGGVGTVRLAPPAFVMFYKITMMRDDKGKQDGDDLRRLHELGLLDYGDRNFNEMMTLMVSGHPDVSARPGLFNRIKERLAQVIRR